MRKNCDSGSASDKHLSRSKYLCCDRHKELNAYAYLYARTKRMQSTRIVDCFSTVLYSTRMKCQLGESANGKDVVGIGTRVAGLESNGLEGRGRGRGGGGRGGE